MDKKHYKGNRIGIYLRFGIMVGIALLLMVVPIDEIESRSFCIIYHMTKQRCLGCGMTRAFANILRLNFRRAIEYNALILIMYPIYLIIVINDATVLLRKLFGKNSESFTDKLIKRIIERENNNEN